MDLWIRSQDKMTLELAKRVAVVEKHYILVNGENFGKYKTKQQALEVLNKIQGLLVDRYVVDNNCYLGSDVFIPGKDAEIKVLPKTCVVYQMPLDINEEAE